MLADFDFWGVLILIPGLVTGTRTTDFKIWKKNQNLFSVNWRSFVPQKNKKYWELKTKMEPKSQAEPKTNWAQNQNQPENPCYLASGSEI